MAEQLRYISRDHCEEIFIVSNLDLAIISGLVSRYVRRCEVIAMIRFSDRSHRSTGAEIVSGATQASRHRAS